MPTFERDLNPVTAPLRSSLECGLAPFRKLFAKGVVTPKSTAESTAGAAALRRWCSVLRMLGL